MRLSRKQLALLARFFCGADRPRVCNTGPQTTKVATAGEGVWGGKTRIKCLRAPSLDWLELSIDGALSPKLHQCAIDGWNGPLGITQVESEPFVDRAGVRYQKRIRSPFVLSWDIGADEGGRWWRHRLVFGGANLTALREQMGGGDDRTLLGKLLLGECFRSVKKMRVRRLDLCADFAGLDVTRPGRWCWRTKRTRTLTVNETARHLWERLAKDPEAVYRDKRGIIQTLYFGALGAPLRAAIYDKGAEAKARSADHAEALAALWRARGWDGQAKVWRVEFRLRGRALDEYRLRSFLDLRGETLRGLWWALAGAPGGRGGWLWQAQRPRGRDRERWRWPVRGQWRAVQEAPGAGEALPRLDPPFRATASALAAQVAGCLETLDVITGGAGDAADSAKRMLALSESAIEQRRAGRSERLVKKALRAGMLGQPKLPPVAGAVARPDGGTADRTNANS